RRRVLADITRHSRLQRAGYVNVIVMHTEYENTHLRIGTLQPSDQLQTANTRQVQIENDEGGALLSENAQRLPSVGCLADFNFRLSGKQTAHSRAHDRMVIDNENLHGSAASTGASSSESVLPG